ncbi:MAG: hypothetical protein P8Z79_19560 [Sedimentisphaerales bacterium]|jgi:hypothetical protein
MSKKKRLSAQQLTLIEDLFAGEKEVADVLKKHKVSFKVFNRWLTNPAFAERCNQRMADTSRKSALLLARGAPEAAAALLKLAKDGSGETARKACLDIINIHLSPDRSAQSQRSAPVPEPPKLSPKTASKLLAVLAEERSG